MPAYKVDADDIKSKIDIRAYIERDVGTLEKKGNVSFCKCPFHKNGAERTPSFAIYSDNFYCFGCGAHGDVIGYVQRRQSISFREALDFLASEMQLTPLPPPPPKTESAPKKSTVLTQEQIEKYQGNLHRVKPYLEKRSIVEDWLIKQQRIGGQIWWRHYIDRLGNRIELNCNYVCLPYLLDNRPYSQNFRRDDESCKRVLCGPDDLYDYILGDMAAKEDREPEDITQEYMFSKLFGPRFWKPQGTRASVYGAGQLLRKEGDQLIYPRTSYAIVTEGEFNALSCMEYGYTAVALKAGQGVDAKRLFQNTRIVYIAVDNDEAGMRYAQTLLKDLDTSRVQARLMTMPHGCNDLNDLTNEGQLVSFLSGKPYFLEPVGI